MSSPLSHRLSRRERQIMDAVYALGQASAVQVLDALPDPPGLSSVRKLILILEEKGHLRHVEEGKHHVYVPTQPRHSAARSALHQVVQTFFGGNVEQVVTTLLADDEIRLSGDQVARLTDLIGAARAEEEENERP